VSSAGSQAHQFGLAQRFVQFSLRLMFFPQLRSINAPKPRPFLVVDHAQRLSIGVFSSPERNKQMIGAI